MLRQCLYLGRKVTGIRADSDDELTSVSDVPERTAEEDLLREVGLSDPS